MTTSESTEGGTTIVKNNTIDNNRKTSTNENNGTRSVSLVDSASIPNSVHPNQIPETTPARQVSQSNSNDDSADRPQNQMQEFLKRTLYEHEAHLKLLKQTNYASTERLRVQMHGANRRLQERIDELRVVQEKLKLTESEFQTHKVAAAQELMEVRSKLTVNLNKLRAKMKTDNEKNHATRLRLKKSHQTLKKAYVALNANKKNINKLRANHRAEIRQAVNARTRTLLDCIRDTILHATPSDATEVQSHTPEVGLAPDGEQEAYVLDIQLMIQTALIQWRSTHQNKEDLAQKGRADVAVLKQQVELLESKLRRKSGQCKALKKRLEAAEQLHHSAQATHDTETDALVLRNANQTGDQSAQEHARELASVVAQTTHWRASATQMTNVVEQMTARLEQQNRDHAELERKHRALVKAKRRRDDETDKALALARTDHAQKYSALERELREAEQKLQSQISQQYKDTAAFRNAEANAKTEMARMRTRFKHKIEECREHERTAFEGQKSEFLSKIKDLKNVLEDTKESLRLANTLKHQHITHMEGVGKRAKLQMKLGQEELVHARTAYRTELAQQLQLLKERAQAEHTAKAAKLSAMHESKCLALETRQQIETQKLQQRTAAVEQELAAERLASQAQLEAAKATVQTQQQQQQEVQELTRSLTRFRSELQDAQDEGAAANKLHELRMQEAAADTSRRINLAENILQEEHARFVAALGAASEAREQKHKSTYARKQKKMADTHRVEVSKLRNEFFSLEQDLRRELGEANTALGVAQTEATTQTSLANAAALATKIARTTADESEKRIAHLQKKKQEISLSLATERQQWQTRRQQLQHQLETEQLQKNQAEASLKQLATATRLQVQKQEDALSAAAESYHEKLGHMRGQLDAVQTSHNEFEQTASQSTQEVLGLQEQLAAAMLRQQELVDAREEHLRQLKQVKDNANLEAMQQAQRHKQELQQLQSDREVLEGHHRTTLSEYERGKEQQQLTHQREIQKLQARFEAKRTQKQQDHEQELHRLAVERKKIEKKYQMMMAEQEQKAEQQLHSQQTELQQLAIQQDKIATEKEQHHAQQLRKVNTEREDLETKYQTAIVEHKQEAKQQLQTYQQELSQLVAKRDEIEQQKQQDHEKELRRVAEERKELEQRHQIMMAGQEQKAEQQLRSHQEELQELATKHEETEQQHAQQLGHLNSEQEELKQQLHTQRAVLAEYKIQTEEQLQAQQQQLRSLSTEREKILQQQRQQQHEQELHRIMKEEDEARGKAEMKHQSMIEELRMQAQRQLEKQQQQLRELAAEREKTILKQQQQHELDRAPAARETR